MEGDSPARHSRRKTSQLSQEQQGLSSRPSSSAFGVSRRPHSSLNLNPLSVHTQQPGAVATFGPSKSFLVSVTGRIESAKIFGVNNVYCKYNLVHGTDWQITAGMEEGISQITEKDSSGLLVWNFPLEVTFKSTNPFGWPQLVISIYGSDFFGNHVVRGYGATHFPVGQGSFTKEIALFVPESSSFLQQISSWITSRRPEFIDPKIVAQNEGRQIVRVNSSGKVTVKFEIMFKDLTKLGYSSSAENYDGNNMVKH